MVTHIFWQGLLKSKEPFLSCCSFLVGKGDRTRFWEDKWLKKENLGPRLYSISLDHNITMKVVIDGNFTSLSFRRARW